MKLFPVVAGLAFIGPLFAATTGPEVLIVSQAREQYGRFRGAEVEGDRVTSHVYTNPVYITVVAFDLRSLVPKKPVLLWRTCSSIESIGHDLTDSFALMLAGAAPYFGRDTDKPVFIDDRARNAKATFGELKVLELDVKNSDAKPAADKSRTSDHPQE